MTGLRVQDDAVSVSVERDEWYEQLGAGVATQAREAAK